MIFETIVVGQLGVNCFILADQETKEGVVVDPGADTERILAVIRAKGLTISYVINTHGHFDHMGGNRRLLAETGATLMIHAADEPYLTQSAKSAAAYGLAAENSPAPGTHLTEGQNIRFGRHEIRVIHTPGHTPGGCCLYLAEEGILLSGDTLFAESIGRTDFPGGSYDALAASVKGKLFTLPETTKVYPGHGPMTTISHEKVHNPYLGSK